MRCVDIVRPYHELEYVSACEELAVEIFVVGEDWGCKPHNLDVERYLNARGKQVIQVYYSARTSSTRIKQTVIDQRAAPSVTTPGLQLWDRTTQQTPIGLPLTPKLG